MHKTDFLIVGSGLTGSVIARILADTGLDVLIVERRSCCGGNVFDFVHPSGIRIHRHGPHYFRTSSGLIWGFVRRFASFYPYQAVVKTDIGKELETWPVTTNSIERICGSHWRPGFEGIPRNFEEACLAVMPKTVYEVFIKEYTEKQWGGDPKQLEASLAGRCPVRPGDDPRLTPNAKYQGLPINGYTSMIQNMLEGIDVVIEFDYLRRKQEVRARRMVIFTGSIDEFFGYQLGRLKYRAQRRRCTYHPNIEFAQPYGQINNPLWLGGDHIRTIEWKHMMQFEEAGRVIGTVVTKETPYSPIEPDEYEYPMPDTANKRLLRTYKRKSESLENVVICGRLGEYRYLDMDEAIGRAINVANGILRRMKE